MTNFVESRAKAISTDDHQQPEQPIRRVIVENSDVRSISFPAKMGDLVETVLAKIIPSRKSSDDLKHSEPTPSKILPLEPLKIDEIQTSPVLGEIEIFRPVR